MAPIKPIKISKSTAVNTHIPFLEVRWVLPMGTKYFFSVISFWIGEELSVLRRNDAIEEPQESLLVDFPNIRFVRILRPTSLLERLVANELLPVTEICIDLKEAGSHLSSARCQ